MNFRREPFLSQICLEVHKTVQIYSACLNKQNCFRCLTSVFLKIILEIKLLKIKEGDIEKNAYMNGILFFILYFYYKHNKQLAFKISNQYLHFIKI